MAQIPKIIHQVWVGDKKRPDQWMDTWKEFHPDWEYVLWDNKAVRGREWRNQKHLDYMWAWSKWHGVADIIRYEILHEQGGVALPADSECVNPIDELLEPEFFTCYENEAHFPGRLCPVMGSVPRHPFLDEVIEQLKEKKEVNEPWIDTGNCHLTEVYEKTKEDVVVYPSYYFLPNHRLGGNWNGKDKAYALQFSGTTFGLYE